MITEIIAIYAITDNLLKAIGHHEDCRVQLSNAAVIKQSWLTSSA